MARARLFRTLTVPAKWTGDPVQQRGSRAGALSFALDTDRECKVMTRDGWTCGKHPTRSVRVKDGEIDRRFPICSQHTPAWEDGRAMTFKLEVVEREV